MSNIHKSREYKDIFIDNNNAVIISKLTVILWFYTQAMFSFFQYSQKCLLKWVNLNQDPSRSISALG